MRNGDDVARRGGDRSAGRRPDQSSESPTRRSSGRTPFPAAGALRSAPSAISANAGVKSTPYAPAGEDDERHVGERARAEREPDRDAERRRRARPGSAAARRAGRGSRPESGEIAVSSAALTSQTAPMAAASQPAAARWSGASVERTPKRNDGNAIRARPPRKYGLCSARRIADQDGSFRRNRLDPQRPRGEDDREAGERREHHVAADERGRRSDHRPEQRSEHGRAHRGSDQLAAALARGRGEQPRERTGPGEAAAHALQETRPGERPEAVGEGEAEARKAHQRQPDEDGAPRAEPCCRGSSRQAADERAGRVRGDEDAGSRLREMKRCARSGGGAA